MYYCIHGTYPEMCTRCQDNKKTCRVCQLSKLRTEFSGTGVIGQVKTICKPCEKLYMKEYSRNRRVTV